MSCVASSHAAPDGLFTTIPRLWWYHRLAIAEAPLPLLLPSHSPPCLSCSGAADWYWALPPITRGLLTCYLVTGLTAYIGLLPLKHLYHDWRLCFKLLPQVGSCGCCKRGE